MSLSQKVELVVLNDNGASFVGARGMPDALSVQRFGGCYSSVVPEKQQVEEAVGRLVQVRLNLRRERERAF